jgi:hypothetical protein
MVGCQIIVSLLCVCVLHVRMCVRTRSAVISFNVGKQMPSFISQKCKFRSSVLQDTTLCSPLKVNRHFRGTCRLRLQGWRITQARNQHEAEIATCFTLVSCLAYFLTLKMEAVCSTKKLVGFAQTTQCYIPEDRTLHNHYSENLKSYMYIQVSVLLLIKFIFLYDVYLTFVIRN